MLTSQSITRAACFFSLSERPFQSSPDYVSAADGLEPRAPRFRKTRDFRKGEPRLEYRSQARIPPPASLYALQPRLLSHARAAVEFHNGRLDPMILVHRARAGRGARGTQDGGDAQPTRQVRQETIPQVRDWQSFPSRYFQRAEDFE